MKKKLTMVAALVLVFALGVTGTLAYLTATSDTITNTFTVGNVAITLTETTSTNYKIVPGATNEKDPTITVTKGSEACYLYACVENGVKLDDGTHAASYNIVTDSTEEEYWTKVAEEGDKTLYRYNKTVDAASAAVTVKVFTEVEYFESITAENIGQLDGDTIKVTAFAHQSANVGLSVADQAAKNTLGVEAHVDVNE